MFGQFMKYKVITKPCAYEAYCFGLACNFDSFVNKRFVLQIPILSYWTIDVITVHLKEKKKVKMFIPITMKTIAIIRAS